MLYPTPEGFVTEMRYVERFRTVLSRIGLGAARFGSLLSEDLSFQMMDLFIQNGGNVIDTARNYYEWVENGRGASEKTIGKWLTLRGIRDKVVLSTKGGVKNNGGTFVPDLSLGNLMRECEESLDALRTDRLDIYLLHRDEPGRPVGEIMDALQELKTRSGARAVGVCNWSAGRVRAANEYAEMNGLTPLDIVQTYWSIAAYTKAMWNDPTTTGMDEGMYTYLLERNMTAMAFTSQAKGFFQKAVCDGVERVPPKLLERVGSSENMSRLRAIQHYCEQRNVSPTAVVNAYITQNPLPSVALVSCSSLDQLRDILQSCEIQVDDDWLRRFDPISSN